MLPEVDMAAIFAPYGKQAQFLASRARNRLFLGGRFAGKSWTLTLDCLMQAMINPGVPGALLGRTENDLKKNLLIYLQSHLDTLQEATGFNWVKRYSAGDQSIELHNGSTIWWKGYDRITKLRGLSLAWVACDEVAWSETDSLTVYETILPSIRVPCPRPSFAAATSPNGLRGMVKLFRDRQLAEDPEFFVTRATSYANPYVEPAVVEACKSAMGARRFEQEIMAKALRPSSSVFESWSSERHLISYDPRSIQGGLWIFGIDWGANRAAAVAIHVAPSGRKVIVDELARKPQSRGHWRSELRQWIDAWTGHRPPYMISSDRAVVMENRWLAGVYGVKRTMCMTMSSKADQYVRTGIQVIQDALDPADGSDPMLLFSDRLRQIEDDEVAGIIPSMINYRWRVDRDGNPTDVALRDNVHDHACDALRYAMVAATKLPQLNGGRLPHQLTTNGPDGSTATRHEHMMGASRPRL